MPIVPGAKVAEAARARAHALATTLTDAIEGSRFDNVAVQRDGRTQIDCDTARAAMLAAAPIEQLYAVRQARAAVAPDYAFYADKQFDRRTSRVYYVLVLERPSADAAFRERCNDAALVENVRDITVSLFMSTAWCIASTLGLVLCGSLLAALTPLGVFAFAAWPIALFYGLHLAADRPVWSAADPAHAAWAERRLARAQYELDALFRDRREGRFGGPR